MFWRIYSKMNFRFCSAVIYIRELLRYVVCAFRRAFGGVYPLPHSLMIIILFLHKLQIILLINDF